LDDRNDAVKYTGNGQRDPKLWPGEEAGLVLLSNFWVGIRVWQPDVPPG